jgi:hypothetical protein
MPYIKSDSRKRFVDVIQDTVKIIGGSGKSPYIQGEYFGFWVNRLVKRYLRIPDIESESATSFNARSFPEPTKKSLLVWGDKTCSMIDGLDPIKASGDMNYAISAVLWGITGDAEGIDEAGYGVRSYLLSILDKIRGTIVPLPGPGNNSDSVMNFRRHLVVRGVLNDVITEYEARKMREYENKKMVENGDLWENGKLWAPRG